MTDPSEVAARLRLKPAHHDEPWRHWLLQYLAAMADAAGVSRSHFGHVEAAAALELLIRDAHDMMTQLRHRKGTRRC